MVNGVALRGDLARNAIRITHKTRTYHSCPLQELCVLHRLSLCVLRVKRMMSAQGLLVLWVALCWHGVLSSTSVPTTDPHWYFTEFNWGKGEGYAQAVNPGAYFKVPSSPPLPLPLSTLHHFTSASSPLHSTIHSTSPQVPTSCQLAITSFPYNPNYSTHPNTTTHLFQGTPLIFHHHSRPPILTIHNPPPLHSNHSTLYPTTLLPYYHHNHQSSYPHIPHILISLLHLTIHIPRVMIIRSHAHHLF